MKNCEMSMLNKEFVRWSTISWGKLEKEQIRCLSVDSQEFIFNLLYIIGLLVLCNKSLRI